jgi:hypothetical protein
MKQSSFNNVKALHYFILAFILLLGILAIYVSCKSKSPTDANVSSNDALGAQSTTQTTTSSSTTTSVKPGQSPTNTTTLITSRNLTTTSTRTTTSSSSTTSTTTTSRKPTTTIPTTVPTTSVAGRCKVEWCEVTVTIDGTAIVVQKEDSIPVSPGDVVKVSFSVINTGTAPTSTESKAIMGYLFIAPASFDVVDYKEDIGAIPADNNCYTWPDAFQINVSSSANSDDRCMLGILVLPIDCDLIIFSHFYLDVN